MARLEGERFTTFTTRDGLPSHVIRSLCLDARGTLWIGTDAGIASQDGTRFFNRTAQARLPATRVWDIRAARDGLLWFGTESHGAFAFDGQAWTSFDTRDGLAGNSVAAIDEDSNGQIWFGTRRAGLTRYQRKTSAPAVQITQVRSAGRLLGRNPPDYRLPIGEPAAIAYEARDWLTAPGKRQFRLSLRGENPAKAAPADVTFSRNTEFEWTPSAPGIYQLEIQAVSQDLVYSPPASVRLSVFVPWHQRASVRIPALIALVTMLGTGFALGYANLAGRRETRRLKDLMLAQEQEARAAVQEKNRQLERQAEELRERHHELEEALANVKTLRGLVPICASCKKIRDDQGFWQQLETFVQRHSEAQFSHGICPECVKKWYPDIHLDE